MTSVSSASRTWPPSTDTIEAGAWSGDSLDADAVLQRTGEAHLLHGRASHPQAGYARGSGTSKILPADVRDVLNINVARSSTLMHALGKLQTQGWHVQLTQNANDPPIDAQKLQISIPNDYTPNQPHLTLFNLLIAVGKVASGVMVDNSTPQSCAASRLQQGQEAMKFIMQVSHDLRLMDEWSVVLLGDSSDEIVAMMEKILTNQDPAQRNHQLRNLFKQTVSTAATTAQRRRSFPPWRRTNPYRPRPPGSTT